MRPLRIVRDKAYYHRAGTTALAVVTSVGEKKPEILPLDINDRLYNICVI